MKKFIQEKVLRGTHLDGTGVLENAMKGNGKLDKQVDRREFFRNVARAAAVAGIGAIGWIACGRAGKGGKLPAQSCFNKGICSGCRVFERCGLPQALSRKSRAAREES